ncbi:uncharacterized protein CDAR_212931 [Caerostris darwini]|uniref:Uncharacterized protein n=1 Tax=Caerostris darwini TaxID=1538125 RepID=A0AAV4UBL1_9ARAC|nr:uncharacterized protein CDAR_212931 [Caerostris darwini]
MVKQAKGKKKKKITINTTSNLLALLTTGTSRWSHLDKLAADRPDYRHQKGEVLPESASPAHYLTSEERWIPPRKRRTQVEVHQGYSLCLSELQEAPVSYIKCVTQ